MISKKSSWPHGDHDAQAAYWLTKLNSPDASPALRKAFEVWRDEDDRHAIAFEQASSVWEQSEVLMLDPDILNLRRDILNEAFRPKVSVLKRFAPIAAALVLAIVGVAALSSTLISNLTTSTPDVALTQPTQVVVAEMTIRDRFNTQEGEQKTVLLPDGSIIDLNENTNVQIAFSGDSRKLDMTSGQAIFTVAKDQDRPFVVLAGGRSITALGTEFEVKIDQSDMAVTLVEGKIVVDSLSDDREQFKSQALPKPIELRPGQVLQTSGRMTQSINSTDIMEAGAWRRSSLAFNGEKLSTVISILNRFPAETITIDDPSLADLEIGGTYKTHSRAGLIVALTEYYPIKATYDDNARTIHLSWNKEEALDPIDQELHESNTQ